MMIEIHSGSSNFFSLCMCYNSTKSTELIWAFQLRLLVARVSHILYRLYCICCIYISLQVSSGTKCCVQKEYASLWLWLVSQLQCMYFIHKYVLDSIQLIRQPHTQTHIQTNKRFPLNPYIPFEIVLFFCYEAFEVETLSPCQCGRRI